MCMTEKIKRLQKAKPKYVLEAITAKALGALGLGILLASYFPNALSPTNWLYAGWGLLILGILIAIPVIREVHRKKTLVEKITGK